MAEEKNAPVKNDTISSNDLAFERTMLAQERTLMAWVRTSISLISFGFTIYKFFAEVQKTEESPKLLSPRIVGMVMIFFGQVALFFALIQHQAAVKKLKKHYPDAQRSLSSILAILILVFGLILFLGVVFRQ
jgi:putative membrane protein